VPHRRSSENRHALSEQRPAHLPPLNVLIQINISDEQSKSGIPLEALDALAAEICPTCSCAG
jgi:uncharacterized pyridoxal phosphate-containing UPF0001 family protein